MSEQNGTPHFTPGAERNGESSGRLSLRDYLALERTMAANTRTLLSYIRTALSVLIAGLGMLEVRVLPLFCRPLGIVLICISPVPLIVGLLYFGTVRRRWNGVQNILKDKSPFR